MWRNVDADQRVRGDLHYVCAATRWHYKLIGSAVLMMDLLCAPLTAQQNSCLERTLPVAVTYNNGRPVDHLSARNFQGKMHGHKVDILAAEPDVRQRRMVLVLDTSGSMGDFWGLEIDAARRLSNADKHSLLGLVTFSAQVNEQAGFAQGRSTVADALDRLPPPVKGRTALRDGLGAALNMLRPLQFGDAIVLITDGDENASKLKKSEFKSDMLGSGVRLFCLWFAPQQSRMRSGHNELLLSELTDATGGELALLEPGPYPMVVLFSMSSHHEAVKRTGPGFEHILQLVSAGFDVEITNCYRVTLKLSEPLTKPGELKLGVVDLNGESVKDLRVIYPQQLPACQ